MNLLLKEAIFVGIFFLIITSVIMAVLHNIYPNDYAGCLHLPNKSRGKYYIATFISGALAHLLCEYLGINKYYCLHGNACTSMS